MGRILVRNINDAAIEVLRFRAKANGQSLEAAVRELIEREAKTDNQSIVEGFRALRARTTTGTLTPLTADEYREGLE